MISPHKIIYIFSFNLIVISSGLKDPYSNMVSGQATSSGVVDNDEDDDDDDQDFTFKRRCKTVVAIPDRLDVQELLFNLSIQILLLMGTDFKDKPYFAFCSAVIS